MTWGHKRLWRARVKCWLDGRLWLRAHMADNMKRAAVRDCVTWGHKPVFRHFSQKKIVQKSTIYIRNLCENTWPVPIKWKKLTIYHISRIYWRFFYDFSTSQYITLKYNILMIYHQFIAIFSSLIWVPNKVLLFPPPSPIPDAWLLAWLFVFVLIYIYALYFHIFVSKTCDYIQIYFGFPMFLSCLPFFAHFVTKKMEDINCLSRNNKIYKGRILIIY